MQRSADLDVREVVMQLSVMISGLELF